jgi:hypothetical protein
VRAGYSKVIQKGFSKKLSADCATSRSTFPSLRHVRARLGVPTAPMSDYIRPAWMSLSTACTVVRCANSTDGSAKRTADLTTHRASHLPDPNLLDKKRRKLKVNLAFVCCVLHPCGYIFASSKEGLMWSSVAFALMIVMILATAFLYVTGPLQGHDTWVDEMCRNARSLYGFNPCYRPQFVALAAGCSILLWIVLKLYRG